MLQTFNEFEQINRMLRAGEEEEEEDIKNGKSQKSHSLQWKNKQHMRASNTGTTIKRIRSKTIRAYAQCTLHIEHIIQILLCIHHSPRWKSLKKLDTKTHTQSRTNRSQTNKFGGNFYCLSLWTVKMFMCCVRQWKCGSHFDSLALLCKLFIFLFLARIKFVWRKLVCGDETIWRYDTILILIETHKQEKNQDENSTFRIYFHIKA